jgi:hypothetical protein
MAPGRDILWNTRAKDESGQDIFIRQRFLMATVGILYRTVI